MRLPCIDKRRRQMQHDIQDLTPLLVTRVYHIDKLPDGTFQVYWHRSPLGGPVLSRRKAFGIIYEARHKKKAAWDTD